jgi:hypothetical protein
MPMEEMPIAVIMQKRHVDSPWTQESWAAVAVVPDQGNLPPVQQLIWSDTTESYLVSGLTLELYRDENDGYFENWVAPEPKVFVLWRMQDERAIPVHASVSYMEGTRMLDSGESVDGVPMPGEIQLWLGKYLQEHYKPVPRKGRQHG